MLEEPFAGYQDVTAYRVATGTDDPGEPLSHIRPRALLVPPGLPDSMTRERLVPAGPVRLTGRAWSGRAPVTLVEVSTDGGSSWSEAQLAPADPTHPFAWRAWTCSWRAQPGPAELLVRATDERGDTHPVDPEWNRQGMADDLVQRVPVTVLPPRH